MRNYETQSVPTNTLKVGDLIIAHGGLFLVNRVHVSQAHDASEPGGECHANYCDFLGDASPDYPCQIPAHWRDGRPDPGNPGKTFHWNQQGNGLARTCLVTRITEDGRTIYPADEPANAVDDEPCAYWVRGLACRNAPINKPGSCGCRRPATDEGEGPPPGDAYWEGEPEPEPEDNCAHEWNYTGTNYGGDDERWHGEGRVICRLCGADGDA